MKLEVVYKSHTPLSIETDLHRLNKMRNVLSFLKNSEEWKCNQDFTISDVEQLLEEINNVISKVNERFTY